MQIHRQCSAWQPYIRLQTSPFVRHAVISPISWASRLANAIGTPRIFRWVLHIFVFTPMSNIQNLNELSSYAWSGERNILPQFIVLIGNVIKISTLSIIYCTFEEIKAKMCVHFCSILHLEQ